MIKACKQFIPISLFLSLAAALLPAQANSERAWPIITFSCDQSKKEVKLKNEVKWGLAGEKFDFNVDQGTYNPWELVEIKEKGSIKKLSEKKQLKLECRLGKNDFQFVIRPKIFNHNMNGHCGDRLSVIVSIYKNNEMLLDEKPMEKFCNGNAPVLRGIKVNGDGRVKLYEVSRSRFY